MTPTAAVNLTKGAYFDLEDNVIKLSLFCGSFDCYSVNKATRQVLCQCAEVAVSTQQHVPGHRALARDVAVLWLSRDLSTEAKDSGPLWEACVGSLVR